METILNEIKKGEKYKQISKYFDCSHCADAWLVGNCMQMMKDNQFETFQEWVVFYLKSQYYNELKKATDLLLREINKNNLDYDFCDCFCCLLTFILLTTWNGAQAERKAIEYLQRKAPNSQFRLSTYKEDVQFGIDIFKEDKVAIQVKPISFFNKIYKTQYDTNTAKMMKYKEEHKEIQLYYMFYDKDFKFTFEEVK